MENQGRLFYQSIGAVLALFSGLGVLLVGLPAGLMGTVVETVRHHH